jgi:exonuclease-1
MVQDALNWADNMGVEKIVAPYEADAQLAYLSQSGYVDFVVTIDTDLVPFGAQHILYDLDTVTGNGLYYNRNNLLTQKPSTKDLSFYNWTFDMFLWFCILCGCDYMNVKNLGPKRAHGIVEECRTKPRVLRKV